MCGLDQIAQVGTKRDFVPQVMVLIDEAAPLLTPIGCGNQLQGDRLKVFDRCPNRYRFYLVGPVNGDRCLFGAFLSLRRQWNLLLFLDPLEELATLDRLQSPIRAGPTHKLADRRR